MKRSMVCFLVMAALLAFPVLGLAWCDNCECDPEIPEASFADVKGYGDMTANYGTGLVLVDPYTETGSKTIEETDVTADVSVFAAKNGDFSLCDPSCGLAVAQIKLDFNCADITTTVRCYELTQRSLSAVGANDMTTLGGVSLCAKDAYAAGSLDQTQGLSQHAGASFDVCDMISGSVRATYSASQTLNLSTSNYVPHNMP